MALRLGAHSMVFIEFQSSKAFLLKAIRVISSEENMGSRFRSFSSEGNSCDLKRHGFDSTLSWHYVSVLIAWYLLLFKVSQLFF